VTNQEADSIFLRIALATAVVAAIGWGYLFAQVETLREPVRRPAKGWIYDPPPAEEASRDVLIPYEDLPEMEDCRFWDAKAGQHRNMATRSCCKAGRDAVMRYLSTNSWVGSRSREEEEAGE
jgi:hypothetical protein